VASNLSVTVTVIVTTCVSVTASENRHIFYASAIAKSWGNIRGFYSDWKVITWVCVFISRFQCVNQYIINRVLISCALKTDRKCQFIPAHRSVRMKELNRKLM